MEAVKAIKTITINTSFTPDARSGDEFAKENLKKMLDKVIQLMYNILKGMTLPIGRKCMTGVSAIGLRGWVKAYA